MGPVKEAQLDGDVGEGEPRGAEAGRAAERAGGSGGDCCIARAAEVESGGYEASTAPSVVAEERRAGNGGMGRSGGGDEGGVNGKAGGKSPLPRDLVVSACVRGGRDREREIGARGGR